MMAIAYRSLLTLLLCFLMTQCGTVNPELGQRGSSGNMGNQPTVEERAARIAAEPKGSFYYGRRYYVKKTRFWGYLREPGQSWVSAKLVMMREDRKLVPDRLSEDGPQGQRYGYDQNFEYRIEGQYTGRKVYDPNSNLALPEFRITGYKLLDRKPGWLFNPSDRYDPERITLVHVP